MTGPTTDTRTMTVPVSGMTCAACERRVSRVVSRVPGVETVTVSAVRGLAVVRGSRLPPRSAVEAAIRKAGYEPAAPRWLSRDRTLWLQVLAAVAAVGLVGWLAWSSGITDLPSRLSAPSGAGLAFVLLLGLTAGISTCMAMVGGLVLAVSGAHAATLPSGGPAPSFTTRMRPYVAFNVGRVVGFGLLGALLGALGGILSVPARVTAVLILAVALVMFVLGVRLTGTSPRIAAWTPQLPSGLARALGTDDAAAAEYSDVRAALLGAATFFLPCGFTQAVQLYALSTAAPVTAGLVMATFALGTAPGLLALASVPEVATGERRVLVLRLVGVVVIAFALLNAVGGLRLMGVRLGPGPAATTAAGSTISSNVSVSAGVQTVRMTQGARGYTPADTVVYAGMPIRWVITGTAPYDCSAFLRSPDLGVSLQIPEGVTTVDVPAMSPGTAAFACAMGMYSGTLVAVEPGDNGTAAGPVSR